jgi:integrase
MPKMHFTKGAVEDLSFPVELKKLMRKRGEGAFQPKVIDFFESTGKKGRTLILTLTQAGNKIWSVQYFHNAKARRQKIGYVDHSDDKFPRLSIAEAMDAAWNFDVQEALRPKAGTFKDVAEAWFARKVEGRLRSEREIKRQLTKHVYPRWQEKPLGEIGRLELCELLDAVEDGSGARQADAVLATIRSIMRWQEARDDNYVSPVVAKMRRDERTPDQRQRNRILDDNEIKAVWKACNKGQFGAIVRLLLLTGQRRAKIATMKWADIDDEGVWTIASEKREKGNAGRIKLPKLALDLIDAQPRLADNEYVFGTTRGRKDDHFNAWSQRKVELDKKVPLETPWVIHDLRRTTRSLMSKLGVSTEVAERVLGHKRQGVLGVYDRHTYEDEMADALERVAKYIDGLVNPRANVVSLPKGKRKADAA